MAKNRTALPIMHVQNIIMHDYGGRAILAPLQRAIAAARVPVIHVRVGFHEGFVEVNPHNNLIVNIREKVGVTLLQDPVMQFHGTATPLPGRPHKGDMLTADEWISTLATTA